MYVGFSQLAKIAEDETMTNLEEDDSRLRFRAGPIWAPNGSITTFGNSYRSAWDHVTRSKVVSQQPSAKQRFLLGPGKRSASHSEGQVSETTRTCSLFFRLLIDYVFVFCIHSYYKQKE